MSGPWHCSDGGTYYVRQQGARVWWLGMSADQGNRLTNVFIGTLNGTHLTGTSFDVPASGTAFMNTADLSITCSGASLSTGMTSNGQDWPGYTWRKMRDTQLLAVQTY